MKKRALIFMAFLLGGVAAMGQTIAYEKSFERAEKRSADENRVLSLLLVAPMPPNVGPMPLLAGLRDPAIVSKFNEHFVNYRVLIRDSTSAALAKKYKVNSFPAFVFISSKGEFLLKKMGNMPASLLFTMLDEALAESRSKPVSDYDKEYAEGNRSRAFLKDYINKRIKADITDNAGLIEEYVNTLMIGDLNNYNEVLFMLKAGPLAQGRVLTIINTNRKLVDSIFKTELFSVRLAINNRIIENTLASAIATKNIQLAYAAANHTRTTWNSTNREQGQKNANIKMLQYHIGTKDTATFLRQTVDHFNRHYMRISIDSIRKLDARNAEIAQNNAHEQAVLAMVPASGLRNVLFSYTSGSMASELNIGAYSVYLARAKDPAILNPAISWSKRAIELSPNSANHDTLAHLLYRLGMYEEAENTQQKAIELAKTERRNPDRLRAELARIKKRTL